MPFLKGDLAPFTPANMIPHYSSDFNYFVPEKLGLILKQLREEREQRERGRERTGGGVERAKRGRREGGREREERKQYPYEGTVARSPALYVAAQKVLRTPEA